MFTAVYIIAACLSTYCVIHDVLACTASKRDAVSARYTEIMPIKWGDMLSLRTTSSQEKKHLCGVPHLWELCKMLS